MDIRSPASGVSEISCARNASLFSAPAHGPGTTQFGKLSAKNIRYSPRNPLSFRSSGNGGNTMSSSNRFEFGPYAARIATSELINVSTNVKPDKQFKFHTPVEGTCTAIWTRKMINKQLHPNTSKGTKRWRRRPGKVKKIMAPIPATSGEKFQRPNIPQPATRPAAINSRQSLRRSAWCNNQRVSTRHSATNHTGKEKWAHCNPKGSIRLTKLMMNAALGDCRLRNMSYSKKGIKDESAICANNTIRSSNRPNSSPRRAKGAMVNG